MSPLPATTVAAPDRPPIHQYRPQTPVAPLGVTVVAPLFNEQQCASMLLASLEKLERALDGKYAFEFLLVDDGSTDETAALLQSAIIDRENYRIVKHDVNRGIAAAIQSGLHAASHEVVVSIDCDGSYDPLLVAEMIPQLTPGVDLVTASPYYRAGLVENVPQWRLILSRLASRMYAVVCGRKLTCYTSCFRVYRRSAVAPVTLQNERFVGVAELLWKVLDRGGKVVEHPAPLRSRVAGQSKMRVARAALGHLRLIAKIAVSRVRR